MVAREGSCDGVSKTTHVDGIARWSLRAGGGNFLCDGNENSGAEVPAENLSAGSGGLVEWRAGARGRSGSRKRGIDPAAAADAGQSAGEKQEHRSGDARGQSVSD